MNKKDAKGFESDEDRPKIGPAGSYKQGAASLVSMVVELAEALEKLQLYRPEGPEAYDAIIALQSIEKFLEG